MISFAAKPTSKGRPAMESAANVAASALVGMAPASPRSRRKSRVPVAWSMAPATMNSAPL